MPFAFSFRAFRVPNAPSRERIHATTCPTVSSVAQSVVSSKVSGGLVRAYYNGVLQTTLAKTFSGAYFMAGAYTQANCSNSSPCSSSNYGQVLIYSLSATTS